MIVFKQCDNIEPFGKSFLEYHPSSGGDNESRRASMGMNLLRDLHNFNLSEDSQQRKWTIQKIPLCNGDQDLDKSEGLCSEEELYYKDRTVVWSTGRFVRQAICSFSMRTTVQQAFWCSFLISKNNGGKTTVETESGVGIIERSAFSFYQKNGWHYNVAVPFAVEKAWPIMNGVLIEYTHSISQSSTFGSNNYRKKHPILFSILHPLQEVVPVIQKKLNSNKVSYVDNTDWRVIHVSTDPSFIIIFDTLRRCHSIYLIRRCRNEEIRSVMGLAEETTQSTTIMSSMSKLTLSSYSPSSFSPSSLFRSPNISRLSTSRLSISKPHSPSLSRRSPKIGFGSRSHQSATPNQSRFQDNTTMAPPDSLTPLQPDVCLDQMWCENGNLENQRASKAYTTCDFCLQKYICLVVPKQNCIKCIKFEETNDKMQLVLGNPTIINGFDGVNVESRSMMLILETKGTLVLYSGVLKIGEVFLNGITTNVPLASSRRQSLATTAMMPDDEMQDMQLSPVQTVNDFDGDDLLNVIPRKGSLLSLHSNINDTVIIETVANEYIRVSVPSISEDFILSKVLDALLYALPRDLGLNLIQKWYIMKTFPGNENGRSEWDNFCFCLIESFGINCDLYFFREYDNGDGGSRYCSEDSKRHKKTDEPSDEDWNFILDSQVHQLLDSECCNVLNLPPTEKSNRETNHATTAFSVEPSAFLLRHIGTVLYSLHIVYNELFLDNFYSNSLRPLSQLLMFLATQLHMIKYCQMYKLFEPSLWNTNYESVCLSETIRTSAVSQMPQKPQNLFDWCYNVLNKKDFSPVVYIPGLTNLTINVAMMYCALTDGKADYKCILKKLCAGPRARNVSKDIVLPSIKCRNITEKLVLLLDHFGGEELKMRLPQAILLPILEAALLTKPTPPLDWPKSAYSLISRPDLKQQMEFEYHFVESRIDMDGNEFGSRSGKNYKRSLDGMEFVEYDEALRLRFPNDKRTGEIRKLLCSSKPVLINMTPVRIKTESMAIEKREEILKSTLPRSMALSVGRGAFSLGTCRPLPTEPHPIPELCLWGRVIRKQTRVDLGEKGEMKTRRIWPDFHNGVAAALSIGSSKHIDSTWILNHRPNSGLIVDQLTPSHSGFLLGLGLGGHLEKCTEEILHDYFSKQQELATIALILGYSAAKRTTQNELAVRTIALHLPALLVPTSTQLDLPLNVQIASMTGIGLLYQGSGHSHMAKIMLHEINKPPGPELDNSGDLESYSLAAGFSLGLICLGKGTSSMNSYEVLDSLHHYINGGLKRPYTGTTQDLYKTPSVLVHEGQNVNTNVTAPGALVAIALMFLKTHNKAAVDLLRIPDTQKNLEYVRPDLLMLKIISRNLILWNDMIPTEEWLYSNVPKIVKEAADTIENPTNTDDIDYETMLQAYVNIIAGNLFSLSLKYAGSSNKMAASLIKQQMELFIKYLTSAAFARYLQLAGRYTIENILSVLIVALATVEAGSGDLEVLRYCRYILIGFNNSNKNKQLYGSYMAASLATGFILLGAGKYTFGTTNSAVAALFISLFPKWPIHSSDNRYHLQALRHLYVLATERRVLFTRHVDSTEFVTVPIEIELNDLSILNVQAPCVLPPLELIRGVRLKSDRYWPMSFVGTEIDTLKKILAKSSTLLLKLRSGNLSYDQDPMGYHYLSDTVETEVSNTLYDVLLERKPVKRDSSACKLIQANEIKTYTFDRQLHEFAKILFENASDCKTHPVEFKAMMYLSTVIRECVSQDKLEALPVHCQLVNDVLVKPTASLTPKIVSCVKLINKWLKNWKYQHDSIRFLSIEIGKLLKENINSTLYEWMKENKEIILRYLNGQNTPQLSQRNSKMLSCIIVWYNLEFGCLEGKVLSGSTKSEIMFKLLSTGMNEEVVLQLSNLI